MTDNQIIHGEQVPLITLTKRQLEEDWFTLWELYKTKEQECEALQMSENEAGEIIAELKAENEELKEQLKKEIEVSQKWYQIHTDEHFAKLRLKQTLTEIKEIAKWHTTNADSEDVQTDMNSILQLISEVENDRQS